MPFLHGFDQATCVPFCRKDQGDYFGTLILNLDLSLNASCPPELIDLFPAFFGSLQFTADIPEDDLVN